MPDLDNFKMVQKKLEATEIWFLQGMLRISWTAKKLSETVLRENETTRSHKIRICKRQTGLTQPMPSRETTQQNQGQSVTMRIKKKRHQFLLISLKALIKSTLQLLETNKLGLKYKRNNNTRDESRTHKLLLNFLKSLLEA